MAKIRSAIESPYSTNPLLLPCSVVVRAPVTGDLSENFAAYLNDEIDRHMPLLGAEYEVFLTGVPAFMKSITDAVENDLSLMDGIVLPIAFLVMAYVVQSLRLLVIPLIGIGISVMLSFSVVLALTKVMTILSFVSSPVCQICSCILLVFKCCPFVPVGPLVPNECPVG